MAGPFYTNVKIDGVDYITESDLEAIENAFALVDADKMERVTPAIAGSLAIIGASGNIEDSGLTIPASDFATGDQGALADTALQNNDDATLNSLGVTTSITADSATITNNLGAGSATITGSFSANGLTYPTDGTANWILSTDGAGNLVWIDQPDLNNIDVTGTFSARGLAYPTDGTSGQLMTTDGAGTLGWTSDVTLNTATVTGAFAANGLTFPTDGAADQVLGTDGAGNLQFVDRLSVGQAVAIALVFS